MSSLHRQKGRPFWFCAYRSADGKQHFKSTGTSNKAEAQLICDKIGKGAKRARKRTLTADAAREIVEAAVKELMEESGDTLPTYTCRQFFNSWLVEVESEGSESTLLRYRGIVDKFLAFLGHKSDKTMSHIGAEDIAGFRDSLAAATSAGNVNTYLKVLRVVFGKAVKRGVISKSPALQVDKLSSRDKHERRAFKLDELKKLLEVADAEWKTMILVGTYTGLRLG